MQLADEYGFLRAWLGYDHDPAMASPPRTPAHKLPADDGCLVRERVSRFPFVQLAAAVGYEIPG
jgi:hypothetical protein